MYARYKTLRDARGLSDYEIAKQTGIQPSTFSDWKRGKSAPKTEKLVALARFFGVSLDYLVTGEGPPQAPAEPPAPPQEPLFSRSMWQLITAAEKARPDDLQAVIYLLQRLNESGEKEKE